MPRPRPLSPREAKRTLANRFTRVADNLRQLNTKFGMRPTRCFLIWTRWTGGERGAGNEEELVRLELLPTPKVNSLDNVTFSILQAGTVPAGSVKLTEVSTQYTYDQLTGHMDAGVAEDGDCKPGHLDQIKQPNDFFYELVEDGRGDPHPRRFKFRVLSYPFRQPGMVRWTVMLERVHEDRGRDGESQYTEGTQG